MSKDRNDPTRGDKTQNRHIAWFTTVDGWFVDVGPRQTIYETNKTYQLWQVEPELRFIKSWRKSKVLLVEEK